MFSKNADKRSFSKILKGSTSIVGRLSILYVLTSFLILLLAIGTLYLILLKVLEIQDNNLLRDKIGVLQVILHEKSMKEIQKELEWESDYFHPGIFYIRVMDEAGHILLQSPGMEEILPASLRVPPLTSPVRVEEMRRGSHGNGSYIVMATWLGGGQSPPSKLYVQVVLNDSDDQFIVSEYRKKLWLVLFLGVLLSSGLGVVVARRGMQPLAKITKSVDAINVNQLNARISPLGWPKELTALALAFDTMLVRLEDSFTRLSQFSENLAHELRTPINNLMGEAEVAISKVRTADEYRQVLESSLEELARVSSLTEKLLFLARADNPETLIECSELDVSEEIKSVCDFYKASADYQEIELACYGEGFIIADRSLLRRALSNLLANSLQHTPSSGKIEISVHENNRELLEITVRDTGSGIKPEHLPHVFNRFYRGNSGGSGYQGTGLGLAIVKSIMTLHGGTVTVESETGKGTAVILHFSKSAHERCLKNREI